MRTRQRFERARIIAQRVQHAGADMRERSAQAAHGVYQLRR